MGQIPSQQARNEIGDTIGWQRLGCIGELIASLVVWLFAIAVSLAMVCALLSPSE